MHVLTEYTANIEDSSPFPQGEHPMQEGIALVETSRDHPALEQARPQHIPQSARITPAKHASNHESTNSDVELILVAKNPA